MIQLELEYLNSYIELPEGYQCYQEQHHLNKSNHILFGWSFKILIDWLFYTLALLESPKIIVIAGGWNVWNRARVVYHILPFQTPSETMFGPLGSLFWGLFKRELGGTGNDKK